MCARARGMERERTGSKWWSLLTSIGSDVCDVCVGCEVWVTGCSAGSKSCGIPIAIHSDLVPTPSSSSPAYSCSTRLCARVGTGCRECSSACICAAERLSGLLATGWRLVVVRV